MSTNRYSRLHFRRALAAAAAGLLLTTLLPGARGAADQTFTFLGGGYGHSVGMSQFGAYGMALEGYTWQEIVTHYYTGTSVAEVDPQFTEDPLWISLTTEEQRVDLTVIATGSAAAAPVTVTRGNKTLTAAEGETITVEHVGDNRCRVTTPSGELTGSCAIDLDWDGWSGDPTTGLRLAGCSLPDWNAPGGTVRKPCTYARGGLRVRHDNNTQRFDLSLEIDVEDYVLGISESPYLWGRNGGMEALKAQAVAARSYALHRAIRRGDPADRPWCWCQLYDTTVDQFYVGWGHGTQEWIDAVRETEHMVITHPSATSNGALMPIEAFYSSSTFGWTENSEHGFTAYVPYLRSVEDRWSLKPEVGNHSARWTREFSGSALAARLPGLSTVTGLEITKCSTTGAALEITFTGGGGPQTFTTRELRSRLGLRSMQVYNAGSPPPTVPPCPQPDGGGLPVEGGPVTLVGLSIDDDTTEDSVGDGDGIAECGETVEVFTTIHNEGGPVTGIGSTLTSADPYVAVRWNTTSTFPNLAEGAEAANHADWDLTIAADTPAQHTARLQLLVDSANGGPWPLQVDLPVSCTTLDATAITGVPDLNGNGAPETVTALRDSGGRQILHVADSATGRKIRTIRLAATAYRVVALEPVPGEPDLMTALLVREDRGTIVVVADLKAGKRIQTIWLGARKRAPVGLVTVPDVAGGIGFAVLMRMPNGKANLVLRYPNGRPASRLGISLDPIDAEGVGQLGATPAGDVTVLGTRADGRLAAVTLDPIDGTRFAAIRYGADETGIDLEALAGSPGDAPGAIAALSSADGSARVTIADGGSGRITGRLDVPIAVPIDLEIVPDIGASSGSEIAVFGTAADGITSAIVADPWEARMMAGPVFDATAAPIDLAVLPQGAVAGPTLAALGERSASSALISLRDAATGTPLGEIQIP